MIIITVCLFLFLFSTVSTADDVLCKLIATDAANFHVQSLNDSDKTRKFNKYMSDKTYGSTYMLSRRLYIGNYRYITNLVDIPRTAVYEEISDTCLDMKRLVEIIPKRTYCSYVALGSLIEYRLSMYPYRGKPSIRIPEDVALKAMKTMNYSDDATKLTSVGIRLYRASEYMYVNMHIDSINMLNSDDNIYNYMYPGDTKKSASKSTDAIKEASKRKLELHIVKSVMDDCGRLVRMFKIDYN